MQRNLSKNLQRGLVLFLDWSVNGTTAYDKSGNGNNGTLVNTPTSQRIQGLKGWSFNGSNQYVDFWNISAVNFWTWDFSISFSWKPWTLSTYMRIVNKYNSTPTNNWFVIDTDWTDSTKWFFWTYDWNTSSLTTATWFYQNWIIAHYTFTRVSWVLNAYKNWVLFSTSWALTARNMSNSHNVYIWQLLWWWYASWQIIIPMIWNRALSEWEIRQLYTETFIK